MFLFFVNFVLSVVFSRRSNHSGSAFLFSLLKHTTYFIHIFFTAAVFPSPTDVLTTEFTKFSFLKKPDPAVFFVPVQSKMLHRCHIDSASLFQTVKSAYRKEPFTILGTASTEPSNWGFCICKKLIQNYSECVKTNHK